MEKELEALRQILSVAMEAADAPPPTDEVLPTTGLQVLADDTWLPATREVWRAWTGHRAVWGIPYHGPVYSMQSKEDTSPWDGPRVCGCSTCQTHVEPRSRLN